ncbi:7646_t:CDS:1, partial [Gigaspora margarita]
SKKTLLKIENNIRLQLDRNSDAKNNFKNTIARTYKSNAYNEQLRKESEK